MRAIPTTLEGYKHRPSLKSPTIVVSGLIGTGFNHVGIGVVPEGSEGRKVFKGPLVPGPWPYAFTHALVIDNHGGSAAQAEREGAIHVAVGEPFTIDGCPGIWTFRSPDRRRFEGDGAKLERVDV